MFVAYGFAALLIWLFPFDRTAVTASAFRPIWLCGAMCYSLYLTHAPIVVVIYERIVADRFGPGVPAFAVTVALAVPLTIAFARLFASVFETPGSMTPTVARLRLRA